MSVNQIAKATVFIDSQQAEAALKKLGTEATMFADKMNAARKANDKAGFDKAQKQYKAANREMKSYKKTVVDVTAVLNNLNGTSLKKLSATQRKLQTEITSMNRTTKQEIALYNQKVIALKAVKAQTTLLRSEMNVTNKATTSWMSNLANNFNKYSMVIMSAAASIMGIIMVMRKAVDAANEYESSLANLSALTGLTGDNLEWLSKQALDLSGSMDESGIRIGTAAADILEAYTQMGSKRPELLKDKEALASVTKQAIILSQAAKMELVPATNALAVSMNQFNASAEEAPRYINAIAAGSKVGAGNVLYIAEALENTGTSADGANLSVETTIGLIETLAPKFSKASKAGINLRNIITQMSVGADEYNPKIIGMEKALNNLAEANLSDQTLKEMFTKRNKDAIVTLINSRKEFVNYRDAVTGSNVAVEQAIINTDTNAAKLEGARARMGKMAIMLGQKLAPALTFSTNSASYLLKAILALMKLYKEFKVQILSVVAALVAWKTVSILQAKWDAIHYGFLVAKNAITKAYALTVNLITGKIKLATIAQKLWNLAQKANPIGLLIAALAAAGTALYFYSKQLTDAQKAQKRLNDVQSQALKSIAAEKVELDRLLRIAKDMSKSRKERLQAVKDINAINPEFLGNIKLETINTAEATTAVDNYNKALEKKARTQAAQESLIEIEKELIDLKLKGTGAELSYWQMAKVAAAGKTGGFLAAKYAAENLLETEKDLIASKKQLIKILDEEKTATDEIPDPEDPKVKDFTSIKELKEEINNLVNAKLLLDSTDLKGIETAQLTINAKQAELKAIEDLGKASKNTNDDDAKKLEAQEKYQQQIINADKSLLEQEEIAHNERLKKAGLYGINVEKMTKKQLLALEALTVLHIDKIVKLETKGEKNKADKLKNLRDQDLDDIKLAQDTELLKLQTKHADELSIFEGSDKEKKALIKIQNDEEIQIKINHLNALQQLLGNTLNLSIEESMLSDEELAALQFKMEQVKLAIALLNLELNGNEDEGDDTAGKGAFWKMLGLDEDSALEDKIAAIGQLALNTFSDINRIISNSENQQLKEFEKSNNKKKKLLNDRLEAGTISQENYNARITALDEKFDAEKRKVEHDQAVRAKALGILNAVINTAIAISSVNPVIPLMVLAGVLGAIQIGVIASEPVPALASGNSADVLADDGKTYNAKVTNNNHKSGLFDKPTVVPGFGIFGETAKPELVFNPVDTQRIMDTPALVEAINMTVKGAPVYALGNSTEIITNNNSSETFTDPALIELMLKLNDKLDQPSQAILVADENYLITHNEKAAEYNEFQSKVNS